jgi:uncharacterized phiE125 gp8 family phage protein
MAYRLRVITPPAVLPISLKEAKDHLRVDTDDDDALIEGLIAAAVGYFDGPDGILNRALITQTLELTLPEFPCGAIMLPCAELIGVVSLVYATLGSPDSATLAVTSYQVDRTQIQARLLPAYGSWWPSVPCGLADAVRVTYRAGDGAYPGVLMEKRPGLRAAMLLLLGDLYENREPMITGAIVSHLDTLQRLWYPHKVGLE